MSPSIPVVSPIQETDLLVAFADLTQFARFSRGISDIELFRTMNDYFELVGVIVAEGGGTVIKFIGDAGLFVFPHEGVDAGVRALHRLQTEGDAWLETRGLPCRHQIKAHFGPVVLGPIGARGTKRLDVYGQTVNTAALLKGQGLSITSQVFRKLAPATRKRFKKHTPPVTYIPVQQRHE